MRRVGNGGLKSFIALTSPTCRCSNTCDYRTRLLQLNVMAIYMGQNNSDPQMTTFEYDKEEEEEEVVGAKHGF